jgi:hypothetical protein
MGVEGREDEEEKPTGVEGSGVMGVAGSDVSTIIISLTISSAVSVPRTAAALTLVAVAVL